MKLTSNKGKVVDMARLSHQHEDMVAAGNAGMNARGDRLKGGKVVVTREEIAREYHRNKTTPVSHAPIVELDQDRSQYIEKAAPAIHHEPSPQTPAPAPEPTPLQDELKKMSEEMDFMTPDQAVKATKRKISQGE